MNHINPRVKILSAMPTARRTDDLDHALKLVLRAYRSWVKGIRDNDCRSWNEVWNAFTWAYGTRDGKLALTWFVRMINVIREHAGRTVHYHQPGCPCLGDDERAFLGLVGACRLGQAMTARASAEALVTAAGVGDLIGAAGQLALVLGQPERMREVEGFADVFDLHAMAPASQMLN